MNKKKKEKEDINKKKKKTHTYIYIFIGNNETLAHEPLDANLAKKLTDLDKQISLLQIEISEQRRNYSDEIKKMTLQEINIKNKEIKKIKINDVSPSIIEIGKKTIQIVHYIIYI